MSGQPHTALVAAVVAAVGLACATGGQFDSLIETGQYEAAAAEFARDSTLHQDPAAALQMAELYANPRGPLYDRDRAITMLEHWLQLYPENSDHYRAELTMNLLTETRRLEILVARQDSLATRLAAELTEAGASRDALEERIGAVSRYNLALADSLEWQEARIDELTADLSRVRQELEALKKIDVSTSQNGGS